MNIKQAKEYIGDSVRIYLKKDEFGEYRISPVRQRPIFLLGAPGIGKTAVMEQIAQEMGIALVSYSMTHHTRQSALGLPFIRRREYGGREVDISEYTMSEIIASVYDVMEESGILEGILFLDEINCVSETLAPAMLQFLQYKTFGRHKLPEGWVVVTAGNPPEFNKSVREFDVATLDRLRVLEVEADYEVWKDYAREVGIHGSILQFLDIKKEYFYRIETTVKGRSYVTARGWEDLSEILCYYEEGKMAVDETLIAQYLRNERIVKEFAAFYDLYQKYKETYRAEDILSGQVETHTIEKAAAAPFDERLSLLGMLVDKIQEELRETMEQVDCLSELTLPLKGIRAALEKEPESDSKFFETLLERQVEGQRRLLEAKEAANALAAREKRMRRALIRFWEESGRLPGVQNRRSARVCFAQVKEKYDGQVADMKARTLREKKRLTGLFSFTQRAFADGNEMLLLVTELTVRADSARFIGAFGCEEYQRYSQEMMLSERQGELQEQIRQLEI